MTKNRLSDLNDHLFLSLERLNNEGLKAEELELEVKRAAAISSIGQQIINSADKQLKAMQFIDERININAPIPTVFDITRPQALEKK